MQSQHHRRLIRLLLAGLLPLAGCAMFNGGKSPDSNSSLSSHRSPSSDSAVSLASHETEVWDERETADAQGLEMEDFYPSNISQTVRNLTGHGPDHDMARTLYGEGEQLYRQAIADHTENNHQQVVERFEAASAKFSAAASRWPDSALEEDALFRAAESLFFADQYVKANEQFEVLLKKFPNTRYLDIVGARRFLIAEYWLQLERAKPRSFWQVNLTDNQRPWADTQGHAVRIFDRMRLDDPTGKLADDATIAAANACLADHDFAKADQYYSDLRKTFPSSEHQFMAHFLGLKAKLASYKGPDYAGASLEEAEKLITQMRRQFPAEARQHEEEINRAYHEVRYKLAEREWDMAQFYDGRSEFGAARFYYDRILEKFEDTPFANDARIRIEAIAGEPSIPPQQFEWLVRLFPDPTHEPLIATSPDAPVRR